MQKRSRLALIAGMVLVLALDSSAAPVLPGQYIGTFVVYSSDPQFGGISGFEISDDGRSFVALSDRARWTEGRLNRNEAGKITGITAAKMRPLLDETGKQWRGERADSEGLAIAPNGRAYVSFEGKHSARVVAYARMGRSAQPLPSAKAFANMPANSALEALAVDAAGAVYTMPEDPKGPYTVFRFRNGAWDSNLTISHQADFQAAGADFGPDGRFYLLERGFHGIFGFSSRVRSFALTVRGFRDERVEMQSNPGTHDNLEGLAVWRDEKGDIRLTMIADDNFYWVQRNEVVEYRVTP
ncbi:esterase-like activity of phytase family protein [Pseudorhodobacter sp.]|uniref:esterase-like activity of phytase family protein n=1 Tax=Pseudorhodobacter sp. TaxID=1934400 RepID=UPI002649ADB8|nr:esterase-like activity of phytase family protein [Pseudorhodobacter sp.]MDN5786764.1 esterase-like activity of phytase family protein [Pseudorhodobacter sp.]